MPQYLKLFFIRAYSIFAMEEELIPIMHKFESSLQKMHDYEDYEQILSPAGLPYLCKRYGYDCFSHALSVAEREYLNIDPLLRGFFTLNEDGDFIDLLSPQQCHERTEAFLKKKGLK